MSDNTAEMCGFCENQLGKDVRDHEKALNPKKHKVLHSISKLPIISLTNSI